MVSRRKTAAMCRGQAPHRVAAAFLAEELPPVVSMHLDPGSRRASARTTRIDFSHQVTTFSRVYLRPSTSCPPRLRITMPATGQTTATPKNTSRYSPASNPREKKPRYPGSPAVPIAAARASKSMPKTGNSSAKIAEGRRALPVLAVLCTPAWPAPCRCTSWSHPAE